MTIHVDKHYQLDSLDVYCYRPPVGEEKKKIYRPSNDCERLYPHDLKEGSYHAPTFRLPMEVVEKILETYPEKQDPTAEALEDCRRMRDKLLGILANQISRHSISHRTRAES